jgi:hypothetical protein
MGKFQQGGVMAAFVSRCVWVTCVLGAMILAPIVVAGQPGWVQQPAPADLAATVWDLREPGKDGSFLLAIIPNDGAAPGEPLMLSAMFTAAGRPLTIRKLVFVQSNAAGIQFDLQTVSTEIPDTLKQTTDAASRLRVLRAGVEVGPTRGPWDTYKYYVPAAPSQYEVPFGATNLPVDLVLTENRLRASVRSK